MPKEKKTFTIDSNGVLYIDGIAANTAETSAFDESFPGRRAKAAGEIKGKPMSPFSLGQDGSVHVETRTFRLDVDREGNLEFVDKLGGVMCAGPAILRQSVGPRTSAAQVQKEDPFLHWIANIPERILRFASLAAVAFSTIVALVYSTSSMTGLYVVLVCMASFALLYPRGSS